MTPEQIRHMAELFREAQAQGTSLADVGALAYMLHRPSIEELLLLSAPAGISPSLQGRYEDGTNTPYLLELRKPVIRLTEKGRAVCDALWPGKTRKSILDRAYWYFCNTLQNRGAISHAHMVAVLPDLALIGPIPPSEIRFSNITVGTHLQYRCVKIQVRLTSRGGVHRDLNWWPRSYEWETLLLGYAPETVLSNLITEEVLWEAATTWGDYPGDYDAPQVLKIGEGA